MAYASITKPSLYFNTKLYTGNGSTNALTGIGHQPDFVWTKKRDGTGDHMLYDAVRGVQTFVHSNDSNGNDANANSLTAFGTDGFTLGSDSDMNANNSNHVAWNWLANGAGSANTAGSINSTVSVNTTAGFSIVSYTGTGSAGATIGHGLGVAPNVIITKARTNSGRYWGVYHSSLGNTGVMALNDTQAFDTSTTYWNDTTPSSTLFTVGTNGDTNSSGTMIAYCFAQKQGYSKFGSYLGNGSSDGVFVYTGFAPAFVMVKKTGGTGNWGINDTKRDFNATYGNDASLYANTNGAETTSSSLNIDLLSNGMKLRSDNSSYNASSGNYIYMAFAEFPFTSSTGTPVTAR